MGGVGVTLGDLDGKTLLLPVKADAVAIGMSDIGVGGPDSGGLDANMVPPVTGATAGMPISGIGSNGANSSGGLDLKTNPDRTNSQDKAN